MLFLFQASLFSVSHNQQNQMEEHASTTTGYTRMGKSFVQTANTSALAWTALLDASPSARMSSRCPNWAARSRGGSRYPDGAVSNSSALRTQRQRALWWGNTGKSTAEKTAGCLKTTLPTGTSWLLCGEENPSLYPVSSLTFFFLSDMCMKCLVVPSLHFPSNFCEPCFCSTCSFQESPNGPHVGQRSRVCAPNHSLVPVLQVLWHRSVHQGDQQQQPVPTGERDSDLSNPPLQPNDV